MQPRDRTGGFRLLNFDQVLPGVFVGTCPMGMADARRLSSALGVTAVLNLQTDEDFRHWNIDWAGVTAGYRERGIVLERVPITDFDPTELIERIGDAAERLSRLLAVGHTVYVHCTAGQQRSPAAVIAYLVQEQGIALDLAVEQVSQRRPCAPDIAALEEVFGSSAHKPGERDVNEPL
jgi:protein-tyrosine phosphatase